MIKRLPKIDVEKLYNDMADKNNAPLLIEYDAFLNMIKRLPSDKNTANIKKMASQLSEVLREEKRLILDIKNSEKDKTKWASRILYFSDKANQAQSTAKDVMELEVQQKRLLESNEKIGYMEEKLNGIKLEREELNLELLRETLEYLYSNMNDEQELLKRTTEDIEYYRIKLQELREQRDALEAKVDSVYNFIHCLMGAETTERMDKRFIK